MEPKIATEFLGATSFPNVNVSELPGTAEKVQAGEPAFKGSKSPSVSLELV